MSFQYCSHVDNLSHLIRVVVERHPAQVVSSGDHPEVAKLAVLLIAVYEAHYAVSGHWAMSSLPHYSLLLPPFIGLGNLNLNVAIDIDSLAAHWAMVK